MQELPGSTALSADKDGIRVNNIYVTNNIVATKFFGSNATSKSLIKFQMKLGSNGLYYYNLDVEKRYKTGQNIDGKDYNF